MKTKILTGWKWPFTLASAMMLLGCLDETKGTSPQDSSSDATRTTTADATELAVADDTNEPPLRAIIPPAELSPGLAEVVKLAQSGVGDDVLLAYIKKSEQPFNPTVEEIVYLKDLGVSEPVLTALVGDKQLSMAAPAVAAAPTIPVQPNEIPAQAPQVPNAPSFTEAPAPSYAVAGDPNYTEPVSQPVTINYFENTLSPYGSWVEVADYGRCWQPTVCLIDRNWRPYCDRGNWVYTSSGWYWSSDYSWGWAPFHYGRWHCDNRVGWVWIPGSTWAPAWVSWRYTDQYCGWAPLPPGAYFDGFGFRYHNSHVGFSFDFGLRDDYYTFIPTSRFCDRRPSRYYVSREHAKTIYRNSAVANNYVRGNNHTVINEGIGRDRVARASHTSIRTVAICDLPTTSAPVGKAEHFQGNSLAVFRPKVSTHTLVDRSHNSPSRETSAPSRPQTHTPPMARTFTSPRNNLGVPTRTPPAQIAQPAGRIDTASSPSPATPQTQTTFPRTWIRSSTVTRNSSAQSPQPVVGPQTTTASSHLPVRPSRAESNLRHLPAQNLTSPQRTAPSATIAENPRQREAAVAPQLSQPQSTIAAPPRYQANRRELYQQPAANSGGFASPVRPAPSVQQPTFTPSQNFNRHSRVEPASPQPSPSAPAAHASAPAPQVSSPRSTPQHSQSSSGNGRPSRSSRDKN